MNISEINHNDTGTYCDIRDCRQVARIEASEPEDRNGNGMVMQFCLAHAVWMGGEFIKVATNIVHTNVSGRT